MPTPHIGRHAASVPLDKGRRARIGKIIQPNGIWFGNNRGRHILTISSSQLQMHLSSLDRYAVASLRTDAMDVSLYSDAATALVIEPSAFEYGMWFGSLNAAGTHAFNALDTFIQSFKKSGGVVYGMPGHETSDVYTEFLHDSFDVVVGRMEIDPSWGVPSTPQLMQDLMAYMEEKENSK